MKNQKPWFLSKEKKDRSNFWKSRSSGYDSSNYWLKNSIFDKHESEFFDTPDSVEKPSKYDHFQLAQYQRAISNFVRILTGRGDISVRYNTGGESYTDGKTITLSPNIKEKEFDTAVGLALHEASHIIHTDFSLLNKTIEFERKKNGQEMANRKKLFWNIVEDLYIDAMTYRDAPGYRGYYASLYQKYFGDKKIEEGLWSKEYATPTWNSYIFHLINIRNPQRNLQALPGLQNIFGLLDLPNITRLSNPKLRFSLATQLYEECEKYISAIEEMKQQMANKQGANQNISASGSGSGEIDYEQLNQLLEQMSDANGDTNETKEEDGNVGGGVDNTVGETKEELEEGTSNTGGNADGDKFVASNGKEIQREIEATNYLQLDKLSDKAKKALQSLLETQKEFINGVARKGRLSKADQNKVDAFASVEIEKKVVGANSSFSTKGLPLYIIRDLSDSFIDSVGTLYGFRSWVSNTNENNIEEGINRGKLLAKKLQLRNEERVLKTSRLDSGKIDKRLLHEIGFDNFDIFSKINITSYKPSFIHISLDQSGSMVGKLWKNAIQFAAMFATASKYINNIHLVISTRSSFTSTGSSYSPNQHDQLPYMMTIFDSKKHNINHIRKFFSRIHANQLTPEGLCFDGIMKETLQMAQNTDAYFINVCDGAPYMYYHSKNGKFEYEGEEARKHSREQMKRMEAGGIKFLTYFIGNHFDFGKVKDCYLDRAVHLQTASEIQKISSTLNKKLLEA